MPQPQEKERYLSAQDDVDTWARVLQDATRLLDDEGVPYTAIGSIATTALGYEENCSDIDLLISSEDADRALKLFDAHGYDTRKAESDWLYKAIKDRVLVDLIFKVGDKNEIEPDEEMFRRARETSVHGRSVRVVSPEDFIVMQAISNKADAPDYWFKGLKAASCEGLDWTYLLRRAQVAPLRVLSLLVYARSEGNEAVPRSVLDRLYECL